jgi:hypothetical protein
MDEFEFAASDKQTRFIEAALSGDYYYLLFGGGIRSGKSYGGLGAIILLSRIFPNSRWAVVRKDLPTLRRNTIPTFDRIRPHDFIGEINKSTWESTCTNGSRIIFLPESIKDDPELNRFHGLEVNGFLNEECDEISEKTFYKTIERAGSWLIPGGKQPHPLVLNTVNPTGRWPKKVFYDPSMLGTLPPRYFFQQATILDNPYIPEEYKESLKNLPPTEYDRFVKGLWNFLEDPDQLIRAEWIWAAQNVEPVPGIRRLGVDVARYGDDNTVLTFLDGNAMVASESFHGLPTDRVADITKVRASDFEVSPEEIRIDTMPPGVVDNLRRDGLMVREVISGASPVERVGSFFQFKNLRSQMWWEFREKIRMGLFSLPNKVSERLVGDLSAPRYRIVGKVIEIESKDSIKVRIGRSTDDGDSLVYAAFDFPEKSRVPIIPTLGVPLMNPFGG